MGHEIKRRPLFLERNAMTNLGSMLKGRNITLPKNVRIVKAMVFPVACMNVRVGPYRRLNTEELMLSNCGTGKGQFSFQSQRKAVPKNDQTTAQLYLSHMLVK